jgi:Chaperone of endosialidase
MPRDGSGIYTTFAGTDGISGATIPSTPYNRNVHDVEQDLNAPRPIVAGGTGASNATQALINLGAMSSTGATMTGTLQINNATPAIVLNSTTVQPKGLYGYLNGVPRWQVALGDGSAETGGNAGSNFSIYRYDDGGAFFGAALSIIRSSGKLLTSGDISTGPSSTITSASGYLVIQPASSALFLRAGTNNVYLNDTTTGPVSIAEGGGSVAIGKTGGGAVTVLPTTNHVAAVNFGPGPLATQPAALNISYHAGAGYGIVTRPQVDGGFSMIFNNAAGSGVGSISNTSTTTGYNTSSDARLKKDLQPFDAGPILDATNVYDFEWISAPGERAHGVIAQEALEVFPEAVTHDDWSDTYGVDYSKFVPLLLQEIKALRARVAALETVAI